MPRTTLQEYFCLRDRPNFAINVKTSSEDAAHYFGSTHLDERLASKIEMGFRTGFPAKIYLAGEYGAGKTHTLYHIKHHFESGWDEASEGYRVLPLVFELEASSESTYRVLHGEMLNAIGMERLKATVTQFLAASAAELDRRMREVFGSDDLVHVMRSMAVGTGEGAFLAWRWLTGESLSPRDRADLGVAESLSGTYDLVNVIVRLGKLFEVQGERLLFLVDEAESLHNVTKPDPQRSWHDGIRKLADQDNSTVSFVLAYFETPTMRMPTFIKEADIITRIGPENVIEVAPMEGVENVRQFVEQLCEYMIDPSCAARRDAAPSHPYPFEQPALELFSELCVEDLGAAVPRNIIRAVSECALETYRRGKPLVSEDVVQQVVPQVVVRPES